MFPRSRLLFYHIVENDVISCRPSKCDHAFHKECIYEWLMLPSTRTPRTTVRKRTTEEDLALSICPVCRSDTISDVEWLTATVRTVLKSDDLLYE